MDPEHKPIDRIMLFLSWIVIEMHEIGIDELELTVGGFIFKGRRK